MPPRPHTWPVLLFYRLGGLSGPGRSRRVSSGLLRFGSGCPLEPAIRLRHRSGDSLGALEPTDSSHQLWPGERPMTLIVQPQSLDGRRLCESRNSACQLDAKLGRVAQAKAIPALEAKLVARLFVCSSARLLVCSSVHLLACWLVGLPPVRLAVAVAVASGRTGENKTTSSVLRPRTASPRPRLRPRPTGRLASRLIKTLEPARRLSPSGRT